MRQQVEKAALRSIRQAGIEGDAQAQQDITIMRQAGIRQQALDLLLPQRHQVAHQHVEHPETDQQQVPGGTGSRKSAASTRSMATSPASITTPESMALIPLGACEWASGSQVCSGTRAALTPKPIRNRAPPAR